MNSHFILNIYENPLDEEAIPRFLTKNRRGVGKYLQDSGFSGTLRAGRILRNTKEYQGMPRNTSARGSRGPTEPGAVEAGEVFPRFSDEKTKAM